jgi:hypothetical protein
MAFADRGQRQPIEPPHLVLTAVDAVPKVLQAFDRGT